MRMTSNLKVHATDDGMTVSGVCVRGGGGEHKYI